MAFGWFTSIIPTEDFTIIYDEAKGDIFGSPNSVDTTTDEESETGDGNSDENINFWSLLIEETARKYTTVV